MIWNACCTTRTVASGSSHETTCAIQSRNGCSNVSSTQDPATPEDMTPKHSGNTHNVACTVPFTAHAHQNSARVTAATSAIHPAATLRLRNCPAASPECPLSTSISMGASATHTTLV